MENLYSSQMTEILEENFRLKSKLAFSIGALEGIKFLLSNKDPNLEAQNLEHLKKIVNGVVSDLRKDQILD